MTEKPRSFFAFFRQIVGSFSYQIFCMLFLTKERSGFVDYGFYNPYNGYSMQPGGFQFNPMNRYQQAPQMPTQAAQSGPEVVPVPTIQQVEQVGLQPGQRKIVMVQNAPVIAMRVADQVSGLIDTKYYNLVEFVPGSQTPAENAEYVTRKEFDEFVQSLRPDKKEAAE